MRWLLAMAVAVGVAVSTAVSTAHAAEPPYKTCTTTWLGGAGSWEDPDKWSKDAVPRPSDTACITADAAHPAEVTLTRSEQVFRVSVDGATVRIPEGAALRVRSAVVASSTLAGPGALVLPNDGRHSPGRFGLCELTDSSLVGGTTVRIHDHGLIVGGVIGLADGSTVALTYVGLYSAEGSTSTRVVDLGGAGTNRLRLKQVTIGGDGTLDIGVRTLVRGTTTIGGTRVSLPHLTALGPGGRLFNGGAGAPFDAGTRFDLEGATLTVPHEIKRISKDVTIIANGSTVRTPDGGNPFAHLTEVDGDLTGNVAVASGRSLRVPGTLIARHVSAPEALVDGYLGSYADGSVDVDHIVGGPRSVFYFEGAMGDPVDVNGEVVAPHAANLRHARLGGLQLSAQSGLTTDLDTDGDLVVTGAAHLDGSVRINDDYGASSSLHDGDQVVLLRADGGISGRFSQVTTPFQFSVTLDYQPDRVIATFHRAG